MSVYYPQYSNLLIHVYFRSLSVKFHRLQGIRMLWHHYLLHTLEEKGLFYSNFSDWMQYWKYFFKKLDKLNIFSDCQIKLSRIILHYKCIDRKGNNVLWSYQGVELLRSTIYDIHLFILNFSSTFPSYTFLSCDRQHNCWMLSRKYYTFFDDFSHKITYFYIYYSYILCIFLKSKIYITNNENILIFNSNKTPHKKHIIIRFYKK